MAESPKMKIDLEVDVEKFARPLRRLAIALEIAATDEALLEDEPMTRLFGISLDTYRHHRDRALVIAREAMLEIEWFDRKIAEKKKADQS